MYCAHFDYHVIIGVIHYFNLCDTECCEVIYII